MPEPPVNEAERFIVFSVDGRKGDRATGKYLGSGRTICEAFATAGAAIEDDEAQHEGRYVCLVIKDHASYRTWTITPNF
jgi:hypothetical protein